MASDVYLRRGAQLDPIRAVLLVCLRRVRSGILGRRVQMYREGCAAHIKDVLDRVLVIRGVRVRLVALVDELAELARRWGRRVELCNRKSVSPTVRKTVGYERGMSSAGRKPSLACLRSLSLSLCASLIRDMFQDYRVTNRDFLLYDRGRGGGENDFSLIKISQGATVNLEATSDRR